MTSRQLCCKKRGGAVHQNNTELQTYASPAPKRNSTAKMSKEKKKKQFTPGTAPAKAVLEDLPDSRYADEEGVETTNILAPREETSPEGVKMLDTKDGTDEYLFKGINPGSKCVLASENALFKYISFFFVHCRSVFTSPEEIDPGKDCVQS